MDQNVYELQRFLRLIAADDPNITMPPRDGIRGAATEAAVRDFQRREGLSDDGVADIETHGLIYQRYLELLYASAEPLPLPVLKGGATLSTGEESFAVTALQYMLSEINGLFFGIESIEQSGRYDSATEAAVRTFQERQMLPVTGITDKATWDKMVLIYGTLDRYS